MSISLEDPTSTTFGVGLDETASVVTGIVVQPVAYTTFPQSSHEHIVRELDLGSYAIVSCRSSDRPAYYELGGYYGLPSMDAQRQCLSRVASLFAGVFASRDVERWTEQFDSGVARLGVLREAFDSLRRYAGYGHNWDSFGAEAISPNAVHAARRLLSHLLLQSSESTTVSMRPFHVAPLRNGGVQIEWERPGVAIEVEAMPDGGYSYLVARGSPPTWQFESARGTSEEQTIRLLGRFLFADV